MRGHGPVAGAVVAGAAAVGEQHEAAGSVPAPPHEGEDQGDQGGDFHLAHDIEEGGGEIEGLGGIIESRDIEHRLAERLTSRTGQ